VLTVNVVNSGYQPRVLHAKSGQAIKMALVTKNTGGCARAFVIPTLGVQQILPPTGTTMIDVPAQSPGTRLFFTCSMGMYSGVIIFDA
jgi:plastocyanin domain-containing protein